jgi:hypothetical protein
MNLSQTSNGEAGSHYLLHSYALLQIHHDRHGETASGAGSLSSSPPNSHAGKDRRDHACYLNQMLVLPTSVHTVCHTPCTRRHWFGWK